MKVQLCYQTGVFTHSSEPVMVFKTSVLSGRTFLETFLSDVDQGEESSNKIPLKRIQELQEALNEDQKYEQIGPVGASLTDIQWPVAIPPNFCTQPRVLGWARHHSLNTNQFEKVEQNYSYLNCTQLAFICQILKFHILLQT